MKEAIYSNTAEKNGIKNISNNIEYNNIIYIAKRMDKVREALKTKIYVTSWFRNKKVNGSKRLYHQKGLAVDFKIKGKTKVSYDQLIYYSKQNRVHINFKKSKKYKRKQYFIR